MTKNNTNNNTNNNGVNAAIGCIGGIVLVILMFIWSALIYGFVVAQMWEWFITPFFGIDPPTIPVALGMAILANYVTTNITESSGDKKETTGKIIFNSFFQPFFRGGLVLLFGWIFLQFV